MSTEHESGFLPNKNILCECFKWLQKHLHNKAKSLYKKPHTKIFIKLYDLHDNRLLYYCIMKCSLAGIKRHARDLFSTGYWNN